MAVELPLWYDLHVHLRQDALLPFLVADQLKSGCAGVVAMPNTKPPTAKVFRDDPSSGWDIEEYRDMILAAGGDAFSELIVPLYLTPETTPVLIEKGAESGLLRACKYYPPHGTTGAGHSQAFAQFMENGVFQAMEECGVVLCIHGEEHGMRPEDYFSRETNAEAFFYRERAPRLADAFPDLRAVAEHVTSAAAVSFVQEADHFAASVTPQHLLYTTGHLVQGLKYHLYCMPLVKFEEDRAALRAAVSDPENTKFFAGTDSAPHTKKATDCGCAAGCYTGGIAPQLYAEAFTAAGVDLFCDEGAGVFRRFLCENGAAFYDLPIPEKTFLLDREPQPVAVLDTSEGPIVPLPLGMADDLQAPVSLSWTLRVA